jgi:predicted dehydrogenase
MAKYRAVILGCGGRSEWHARAYQLVENADVVACCDLLEEPRTRFAEQFGLKGYADLEEMIEKEKPDLIHLVTRPSTRVEQLTLVSEMGVPACIVEKPVAMEVRDWRALCDLAETTRTKIGVGAQWRYSPDMAKIREALRSGALGNPLMMEVSSQSSILDQGVHVLDWGMSLMDESPVTHVFGAASGTEDLDSTHPGPRSTTAQVAFANGLNCLLTIGVTAPEVTLCYEAFPRYTHCRVAVYCERGRSLFEEFGKWEIVSPEGAESGVTRNLDEWQQRNDQAQANLTKAMLDWLADDAKPAGTNLEGTLAQWNSLLGIYASALWGRPVELPFDPPDELFDEMAVLLKSRS